MGRLGENSSGIPYYSFENHSWRNWCVLFFAVSRNHALSKPLTFHRFKLLNFQIAKVASSTFCRHFIDLGESFNSDPPFHDLKDAISFGVVLRSMVGCLSGITVLGEGGGCGQKHNSFYHILKNMWQHMSTVECVLGANSRRRWYRGRKHCLDWWQPKPWTIEAGGKYLPTCPPNPPSSSVAMGANCVKWEEGWWTKGLQLYWL